MSRPDTIPAIRVARLVHAEEVRDDVARVP
jgi:hypothetical protein